MAKKHFMEKVEIDGGSELRRMLNDDDIRYIEALIKAVFAIRHYINILKERCHG